ncbi:MAG TPA: hypothetical protein VFW00_03795 [Rhodocyclaceae bacterium]|nr:hypothetical protein [Rhodocyclaceae bacterium]
MEPNMSMEVAAVLFGIAAIGGLIMAGMRLSGTPQPPSWLAMVHGLLAAAGLTLLIYAAFTVGVPGMAQLAIAFFVVAAIGGAVLNLVFHWQKLALPIPLMIAHAVLAVIGFVLLLIAIFGQPHSG